MKSETTIPTLLYMDYNVKPILRRYGNGRHAIEFVDAETFEPIDVVTVNLANIEVADNFTHIKMTDWHAGALTVLVKAGMVEDTGHRQPYGFITEENGAALVKVNQSKFTTPM